MLPKSFLRFYLMVVQNRKVMYSKRKVTQYLRITATIPLKSVSNLRGKFPIRSAMDFYDKIQQAKKDIGLLYAYYARCQI